MRYNEADIARALGRTAFSRAEEYYEDDQVIAFRMEGDSIHAQVSGTGAKPYRQTIGFAEARGSTRIMGTCTCPVGFNCKHVGAALLFGLENSHPPPAPPTMAERVGRLVGPAQAKTAPAAQALTQPLQRWLDALDLARATVSEDYPPGIDDRLVYVLAPISDMGTIQRLGLRLVPTRLRRDGLFAETARPRRTYEIRSAKHLRPSDDRILRVLSSMPDDGAGIALAGEAGATALAEILATGRARWLTLNGRPLAAGPPRPGRIAWMPAGEANVAPRLEIDGDVAALAAAPPVYVDAAAGLVGPIETSYPPGIAAALLAAPEIPAELIGTFNAALATRAPDLAAAAAPEPERERIAGAEPVPVLRLFSADLPVTDRDPSGRRHDSDAPLTERVGLARLSFRYGPVLIALGEGRPVLARLIRGRLVEVHRDAEAEQAAVTTLLVSGFDPAPDVRRAVPPAHARDFIPQGDALAWLDAQDQVLPRLVERGWEIEIAPDFPGRLIRAAGPFEIDLDEGSGIDWLELHLGVAVDGERIDLVGPIVAMIGQPGFDETLEAAAEGAAAYLPLGDGRVVALPASRLRPIVAAIRDLALGGGEGRLRLARADMAGLAAFEAAVPEADAIWRGGERLREMGRRLTASGGIPEAVLPPGFLATLRPYQHEGVSWLAFLREVGFGGVLADDMGLGKTVQALGLLAIEKARGAMEGPALLVAPTSLMANWAREAARFAPDLRVLTLHGSGRAERFAQIPESDLVLTTYPLVTRDHEVLSERTWHMLILDEAQTIKNPDATTTKLLLELKAGHRFCLTGTPMENHLGELWSLFAFACPNLLGDRRSFSRTWRGPIEKHGDAVRSRLLARRVRPFLLRRTKEEVARDLPSKTEMVERIDLHPAQRDVYDAIRLFMHARVQTAIAERGWARSRIVILDALLKLRQACCDPRLVKAGPGAARAAPRAGSAKAGSTKPGSAKVESAKLDRLDEMVTELLAEGRRILVFSQFTTMLALIEARLKARQVPYALLTGKTRDREAAIALFDDGLAPVFLVSLKAGGTGLNLVTADTVILYDPWWNPAVEEQAIDRAYRIGQTKPVFVHKLVATGTIEEKMETLKERKSALARSLFDEDGTPTLAMTQADLDMLLGE